MIPELAFMEHMSGICERAIDQHGTVVRPDFWTSRFVLGNSQMDALVCELSILRFSCVYHAGCEEKKHPTAG
jgi:hypothetical protein